jgi:hypothetical protein
VGAGRTHWLNLPEGPLLLNSLRSVGNNKVREFLSTSVPLFFSFSLLKDRLSSGNSSKTLRIYFICSRFHHPMYIHMTKESGHILSAYLDDCNTLSPPYLYRKLLSLVPRVPAIRPILFPFCFIIVGDPD